MRFLGNLLWILLCGFWLALAWAVVGVLWCVSIVGIPVGVQCFKFAELMLAPFGKVVVPGVGAVSAVLNILWILFGGIEIAATACAIGAVLSLTIVGLPFGLQCFKFAQLALLPFGARIVRA